MQKLLLIICLACVSVFGAFAQEEWNTPNIQPHLAKMDSLMGASLPKPQLLMLGTFHFADKGLDNYKPKYSLDILSPERQREIKDLVALLAAYQPTKIAIEWRPDRQAFADSLYAVYRSGGLREEKSETVQVAFRLADRLGHERLYCVDAHRQHYPYLLEQLDYERYVDTVSRPSDYYLGYNERYTSWYAYEDSLKTAIPLRDFLLYKNHPDRLQRSHGNYLLSTTVMGPAGDYTGPDLQTSWYNRNLRIYSNLAKLIEGPQERILLLIGAGHLPILRHAALASPALELVEVEEVLGY